VTAATVATTAAAATGVCASVPASTPCNVATKNSGKLAKCVARQTLRGKWARASDVSSTASSR
jgi:hypothetical protein